MGSRSDNGGTWPPDGGVPDGLPELPPEWGNFVIPDDLSSLADEVAAVRAELHLDQGKTRWQRFRRRIGVRRGPGLRGPAIIIAIAFLVTLASLWASAWPGPARTPTAQRTANTVARSLPALELIGSDGQTVPLRGQLPAVILLIDGCECSQLIADAAEAVRPEIAIVTVVSGTGRTPTVLTAGPISQGPIAPTDTVSAGEPATVEPATGPVPPPGATQLLAPAVRPLRDPTNELRSAFNLGVPDGNAAALLVSRTGEIVRTVRRTATIEDIRPDLARL
jgi:hypothetical protein